MGFDSNLKGLGYYGRPALCFYSAVSVLLFRCASATSHFAPKAAELETIYVIRSVGAWGGLNMARVLVVDDDDNIRDTLYELLSEQYICQTAETAEKALARLEADTYDVVLTDISMPGLSGLELLGHVRQRFPNTPVIIVSGISDHEHAQGLIKLGAFEYLLKPFSLEIVEKSVSRALEYRKRLTGPTESESEADDWKIVR